MERRPERPRTRDIPDRRRDRGRGKRKRYILTEAELRGPSGAGGRPELRQEVGGRIPPSSSASAFPWAKGSSEFFVGRSLGDGGRIVALHLVEVDRNASDNVFVCEPWDQTDVKHSAEFEYKPLKSINKLL